MADFIGRPLPQLVELYTKLADGGIGCLNTGCTLVDPRGRHHRSMLSLVNDESHHSIGRLILEVHKHGCPIAIQLVHSGPMAKPELMNGQAKETPDTMSQRDIERVISSFVQGAKTSFGLGADGVQFHSSGT
jgi:2,4-dienoyl-CoA reductase-like NADH-dependent reductase (Old Yellow Enzyme family)